MRHMLLRQFRAGLFVSIAALAPASMAQSADGPARVTITQQDGAYQLRVNGEPFVVKGAGMSGDEQDELKRRGANSFRTWDTGTDRAKVIDMLDRAQRNGLMVAMGLHVEKERHGFNYDDAAAVAKQQAEILREVELYKNHPAVLMWLVGNELNLESGNPNVWNAVGAIADAIHRIDPNHPVMTTLAGIDAPLIANIRTRASSLDLIGIQLYGDIEQLPEKLVASQWTGPYVITEWGPTGHWESPLTSWNAAIEEDASTKAEHLRHRYERYVTGNTRQGLGSYVFLWGQKQERTPTWYGLFLPTGESTPSVDVMQLVWTGAWPENRAPSITPLRINDREAADSVSVAPRSWNEARVISTDPEDDRLTFRWTVHEESRAVSIGGDPETVPKSIRVKQVDGMDGSLRFRAPSKAGAYRLFVEVLDGKGHAAYANFPFEVSAR